MLGHTCRRVNSPAATTPIMHVLTGQCVVQAGPPQAWGIDGPTADTRVDGTFALPATARDPRTARNS